MPVNIRNFNYSSKRKPLYVLPLNSFGILDRSKIRTVIGFSFSGPCASTIDFRDIRYLRSTKDVDTTQPYYLYASGLLAPGYQIGDSLAKSNIHILESHCNYFTIKYPVDKEWGAVFIYHTKPQSFSAFKSLAIEMQGEAGGEVVYIGISDTLTIRDIYRPYQTVTLDNVWKTVEISLSYYPLVNLGRLRVMTSFLLIGSKPRTLHFRNIRYLY